MDSSLCCLVLLSIALLGGVSGEDIIYDSSVGGWLKLHRGAQNWNDAVFRCKVEGGTLASPTSEEMIEAMKSIIIQNLESDSDVFTGFSAQAEKDAYVSLEGVMLSDVPHSWSPYNDNHTVESGEPDVDAIIMNHFGHLRIILKTERHPFICYAEAPESAKLESCGTLDQAYVYDSRTDSCYKFHKDQTNWLSAFMTCTSEGGYLAIINGETEAQVIKDLFVKNKNYPWSHKSTNVALIGLRAWENRLWLTVKGQTLSEGGYGKFHAGEPNNYRNDEECGAVDPNAELYDDQCYGKFVYICEKSPTNNVSTGQVGTTVGPIF